MDQRFGPPPRTLSLCQQKTEAHHGHPTGGGVAGFSQRMHEKVATRISEIVGDGITKLTRVQRLLRQYIMYDLQCMQR